MKNDDVKWLAEYEAFLDAAGTPVPSSATQQVFARMQKLLNPAALGIFLKIFAIHTVVGFLSLGICHQFGMNPFGTGRSLDGWFMAMWGHGTCMIVCGVLFVSLGFLAAGFWLSVEEARVLRRTGFFQALALACLSLAIFSVFGARLAVTFGGLWLLGALIGGNLATEAIWLIKRNSLA